MVKHNLQVVRKRALTGWYIVIKFRTKQFFQYQNFHIIQSLQTLRGTWFSMTME